jgi:predicted transposase/invertase (TIGR01784 family)
MLETTIEKWKQQGVEKGRQEGLEQARAAIRLLRQGISSEQVAKETELPLAEVHELADEINS